VVLHGQVSSVGNQEGEQVAAHAVFRPADQAAKLFAEGHDGRVGTLRPLLVAFEEM